VGDVASLLGRILRTGFVLFVAFAVLATSPLQAAPFAAIVMDARTGEVLYEKNANTRLHPASLTKMMTLYIAFQEIERRQPLARYQGDGVRQCRRAAAVAAGPQAGAEDRQVRYLIRAAAVKSANDAAAALGDADRRRSRRPLPTA
jgi:D-alanyl-D-alanine carboxypeptidase